MKINEIIEFILIESAVITVGRDLSIVSRRLVGFRADLIFVEGVGFEERSGGDVLVGGDFLHCFIIIVKYYDAKLVWWVWQKLMGKTETNLL